MKVELENKYAKSFRFVVKLEHDNLVLIKNILSALWKKLKVNSNESCTTCSGILGLKSS